MAEEYKIIRTRRRTLALQVTPDGLVVRSPMRVSDGEIEKFVRANSAWIEKQLSALEERRKAAEALPPLTQEDIRALADRARIVIPQRVKYYAPLVGVSYGRITIRTQRTKWGSCSGKGNLNFNCLLMLTPPEVLDSVVVHELCHRKEMNHSDRFYAEVLRVYPDYRKWDRWLKENGETIMRRVK